MPATNQPLSSGVKTLPARRCGATLSVRGPLLDLSSQALDSAPRISNRQVIFEHLYAFHTRPASQDTVEQFLGLDSINEPRGWQRKAAPSGRSSEFLGSNWRLYESAPQPEDLDHTTPPAGFKLYLSPALQDLAITVKELFALLPGSRACSVKIGACAEQLLRPDKLVVYLPRYDDLQQLAWRLAPRLAGLSAQGVPFTAALSTDGLMSWGIDGLGGHSWRGFVLRRLASLAPTNVGHTWSAAFNALRHDGVNVEAWRPSARLCGRAA